MFITFFLCLLLLFISIKKGWFGEKNSEEKNALARSINTYLIEKGFCTSGEECNKKLDAYVGRGGKHIAYSLYGISNRKMIAVFIGFVVEHGMEITQGVPVTIDVYPKRRAEYRNFLLPQKSIIEVEVRQ